MTGLLEEALRRVESLSQEEQDAIASQIIDTLDDPAALKPDVHIFTRSKQPWVQLPPGVPAFEVYYDTKLLWPPESLARRAALFNKQSPT